MQSYEMTSFQYNLINMFAILGMLAATVGVIFLLAGLLSIMTSGYRLIRRHTRRAKKRVPTSLIEVRTFDLELERAKARSEGFRSAQELYERGTVNQQRAQMGLPSLDKEL